MIKKILERLQPWKTIFYGEDYNYCVTWFWWFRNRKSKDIIKQARAEGKLFTLFG